MLLCKRCNRRHPDGTEWCSCGAYLPFDSEKVDDPPPPPSPSTPPPADRPLRDDVASTPPATASGTAARTDAGPDEVTAVLPDRPVQRRDAPVTAAERGARPGERPCPRCATPNEPELRFCRHCGLPLADMGELTVDGARGRGPVGRFFDRVRSRLPGGRGRGRTNPQRLYRRGLSWRSKLFRVGLAGGIGMMGIGMIHPALRPRIINAAKDGLPGNPYRVVSPDSYVVVSVPEGTEIPQRGAELVVDRFQNTSWASTWTDPFEGVTDAADDGTCIDLPSAATSALLITFESPTDLARLRILPGRWDGDQGRANHVRPAMVELRYSDGTCDQVLLDDEGVEQAHAISGDDVTQVELRILGVYRDTPNTEVAITEIAFDRSR